MDETAPVSRWQRLRGLAGMGTALALAFVWGAIVSHQLERPPVTIAAAAGQGTGAHAAVLGSEAPPEWVGGFASAFCPGDADTLAARVGPPLTGDVDAIRQALTARTWECADARFLGGGANPECSFFVYVLSDPSGAEQWWVFTVVGEQVVSIE